MSIIVDSEPEVDAQQFFKNVFIALINEDYFIGVDIERHQSIFEHVILKVDFSVGIRINILQGNLLQNTTIIY